MNISTLDELSQVPISNTVMVTTTGGTQAWNRVDGGLQLGQQVVPLNLFTGAVRAGSITYDGVLNGTVQPGSNATVTGVFVDPLAAHAVTDVPQLEAELRTFLEDHADIDEYDKNDLRAIMRRHGMSTARAVTVRIGVEGRTSGSHIGPGVVDVTWEHTIETTVLTETDDACVDTAVVDVDWATDYLTSQGFTFDSIEITRRDCDDC
jgi:hypothetical protein